MCVGTCELLRMSLVAAMPSGSTSGQAMTTSCGHQRSTERTSTEREQEKTHARDASAHAALRLDTTISINSPLTHRYCTLGRTSLAYVNQTNAVCQPNQHCLVSTIPGLPTHIVRSCLSRATLVCISHTVEQLRLKAQPECGCRALWHVIGEGHG